MRFLMILATLVSLQLHAGDRISIPVRDINNRSNFFQLPIVLENRTAGNFLTLELTYNSSMIDFTDMSFIKSMLNENMVTMYQTATGLRFEIHLQKPSMGDGVLFRLDGHLLGDGSTPILLDGALVAQWLPPEEEEEEEQEDVDFQQGGINGFLAANEILFIPDYNLKSTLLALYDADADGELSFTEGLAISTLDISNRKIQSLEGLQWLYRLTHLNAANNQISDINPLIGLVGFGLPKSSLDISGNLVDSFASEDLASLSSRPNLNLNY